MTYDQIAERALSKPEVVEALGCLKRGKRTIIAIKKDGLDIAVKISGKTMIAFWRAIQRCFTRPHTTMAGLGFWLG